MLRTYGELAVLAARRAARSWLVLLAVPALGFLIVMSAVLVAPLGAVGGIIVALVSDACIASYLSGLSVAVAGNKVRLTDLKVTLNSFFDVISVMFALWIINLGVKFLGDTAGSNGPAVVGVVGLAITIFFNVIPELIYKSQNRSFTLLKESATFIMENPFAWFAPNLVFAVAFLAGTGSLRVSSPGELVLNIAGLAQPSALLRLMDKGGAVWKVPLLVAFFHYVMVYRGLLYERLTSATSSRMDEFRRRMA
jgi:hypothetical protein